MDTPERTPTRLLTRRRLGCVFLSVLAAVGICVFTGMGGLLAWSPVNCWHESVDLTCGRTRYERYVLWIRWVDRIEETPVSLLYRAQIGIPGPPVWRRALTLSPGVRNSPHYLHHSGLHDLRRLSDLLQSGRLNAAAQVRATRSYLAIVQLDDDDHRSGRLIDRLEELAWAAPAPLTAAQIPGLDFD